MAKSSYKVLRKMGEVGHELTVYQLYEILTKTGNVFYLLKKIDLVTGDLMSENFIDPELAKKLASLLVEMVEA